MTAPELPPLKIPVPKDVRGDGLVLVQREALERARKTAKARERILLARIAELETAANGLLLAAINVDLMAGFREQYPHKHKQLREAIDFIKPLLPEDEVDEM